MLLEILQQKPNMVMIHFGQPIPSKRILPSSRTRKIRDRKKSKDSLIAKWKSIAKESKKLKNHNIMFLKNMKKLRQSMI